MLLSAFDGKVPNQNQNNNSVRQVIMDAFYKAAPILNYLQWYKMSGSSDTIKKTKSIAGGGVRTIDNPYEGIRPKPDFASVVLRTFGGEVETDRIWDARTGDLAGEHLRMLTATAEGMGRDFMDRFINDKQSGSTWDGIKELVPESQTFLFDESGDGVVVLDDSAVGRKQLKKLKIAIDNMLDEMVDPTWIEADSKLITYLGAFGSEFTRTINIKDIYGKDQTVEVYRGLPIIPAGYKSDQAGRVIGHAEIVGSRTGCTSVYGVSSKEKANLTVATNVGLILYGPSNQNDVMVSSQIDLDAGIVLANDRALGRVEGICLR